MESIKKISLFAKSYRDHTIMENIRKFLNRNICGVAASELNFFLGKDNAKQMQMKKKTLLFIVWKYIFIMVK